MVTTTTPVMWLLWQGVWCPLPCHAPVVAAPAVPGLQGPGGVLEGGAAGPEGPHRHHQG